MNQLSKKRETFRMIFAQSKHCFLGKIMYVQVHTSIILEAVRDTVPEIIDLGPMCITDLFHNKYLALF